VRAACAFVPALLAGFVLSSPARAQYSPSAGVSAPTEDVVTERVDESGRVRREVQRRPVRADGFGNAAGNQHDLAVDGAFDGQTVAVLHLYTGEGFDFTLPRDALKQKGFSVYRWINAPPPPAELEKALQKACQLWIISSDRRQLSDAHIKIIKRYFDAGHGVYIWGDNQPYYADANAVAEALLGSGMDGNVMGDQVVSLQARKDAQEGLLPNHLLTTGLQYLYEGVTIATIRPRTGLAPLLYGSAGNLVSAFYDQGGKRAILDGGFTRLFIKWDTAGTARYVKNAAAWLTNVERFGKAVTAMR
jgi:hypothetical protein